MVTKPAVKFPLPHFLPALALALLLTPRLGSQNPPRWTSDADEIAAATADDNDVSSPLVSTASLVAERIVKLLANPKPNANDCVSLVIDIVNYCEQMHRARQRFPVSIIDDALKAVDWGERLEKEGGDWVMLRTNLNNLLAADLEPWKTAAPEAKGKVAMELGYQPGSEMKNDRRKSRGGVVQDVVDATDLALPLLKLEQVRRQDQPARLFQMLEGKMSQLALAPTNTPEW